MYSIVTTSPAFNSTSIFFRKSSVLSVSSPLIFILPLTNLTFASSPNSCVRLSSISAVPVSVSSLFSIFLPFQNLSINFAVPTKSFSSSSSGFAVFVILILYVITFFFFFFVPSCFDVFSANKTGVFTSFVYWGSSGSSGCSGFSGFVGSSGFVGWSGFSGLVGVSGVFGFSGPTLALFETVFLVPLFTVTSKDNFTVFPAFTSTFFHVITFLSESYSPLLFIVPSIRLVPSGILSVTIVVPSYSDVFFKLI